jgi:hypothetical protein
MRPARIGKAGSFSIGLICSILAFAPVQVQGAEAQARVVAEVMNPAALDTASLLATVTAGAPGRLGAGQTVQQVEPEVSIQAVQGVTWLNIDFN